MLTDFNSLGENSRTWVYQADRLLNNQEQAEILQALEVFLGQWAAHGNNLMASGTIMHDAFLVISTDESFNMASGCSIDSSFRFVQELGAKMQLDFFQRMNLAFLIDEKVEILKMSDLKSKIEEGIIDSNTLFFDNTIQNKIELDSKWCVKAGESWLGRYFKTTANV
jgi:hypothetical protein